MVPCVAKPEHQPGGSPFARQARHMLACVIVKMVKLRRSSLSAFWVEVRSEGEFLCHSAREPRVCKA